MIDNKEFINKNRLGKKQEVAVIVELQRGRIEKIHNTHIYQPIIHFKGGTIKWYEDSTGK